MRPAYLGREEKFTRCTRRVPRSLARSLASPSLLYSPSGTIRRRKSLCLVSSDRNAELLSSQSITHLNHHCMRTVLRKIHLRLLESLFSPIPELVTGGGRIPFVHRDQNGPRFSSPLDVVGVHLSLEHCDSFRTARR